MKSLFLSAIIFFSTTLVYSQISSPSSGKLAEFQSKAAVKKQRNNVSIPEHRTCFTDHHTKMLQDKYNFPSTGDFEAEIKKLIEERKAFRTVEDLLTIPVIVHVVHNGEAVGSGTNISEAQVQSQLDVLNEDFSRTGAGGNTHNDGADTKIQFVLALIGPDGHELAEPGINRFNGGNEFWEYSQIESNLKPNTQWDPIKYFNIWTLKFGGEDADLLGYAQFPNFSTLDDLERSNGVAETDGVVVGYSFFGRTGNVSAPYDKGRTATHEVGHWLGLRHIWGDGDCSVDDYCADTPNAGQPNYTCQTINSCTDATNDKNDMIENYMDYTPDGCMNIFTVNQKDRMRTVMANSPRRKELIQSTVGEITDKPIAKFNLSTTVGCEGTVVDFIDGSTNNPTSWTWNFYDIIGNLLGSFDSQNISLEFTGIGVYTVELVVSNASGTNTLIKENEITVLSNAAVASFNEDIEDISSMLNNWVVVNYDNDRGWLYTSTESAYGSGTNSLLFDNYSIDTDPTGTSDALITPALDMAGSGSPSISFDHAYAIYGEGYVDTLKVAYSLDCGKSWHLLWSKGGNDLATSTATENPFEPLDSEWNTTNISLSFLAGQPSVHLAFINVSGWGNLLYLDNINFHYMQVTKASQASFSANKVKICEGQTVQFEDLSTDQPNFWAWSFEGGNPTTSGAQNPSTQFSAAGLYDVSLTASNSFGGSTETKMDYIEVIALPIIAVEGPQQVCEGDEITLSATGGSNIKWLSRGAVIFEGPLYTLTIFEDQDLQVIGENELGCSGSLNYTVTVTPRPVLEASANATGLCEQGNVTLSASGASTYEWYNGNTLIGTTASFETLLTQSTTYNVTGFSDNGVCESSADVFVELYSVNQPIITQLDGTLSCSDAVGYQWYLDDVKIEGAILKTYTPDIEGSYKVEVIDNNGCVSISQPFFVEITGIEREQRKIVLYPNPASEQLKLHNITSTCLVNIYNSAGHQVLSETVNTENDEISINIKSLKNGLYFVHITNEAGSIDQQKFIKQ